MDFLNAGRDKVIEHLEEYYGKECVCHVGTYSEMGVKSSLKDICRVLEIPFQESNDITKAIDSINDSANVEFKDLDAMEHGNENEQAAWDKFHVLETKYAEIFRLARAFEGIPRNQGVHASAILVTPMPVTDLFPVRYKDGVAVTLYHGKQLEHYGAIKYDFLGLKTIDVITKALENIPEIKDIFDLYEKADIEDPKVWKYISSKETEGVFQIESNMMKGIIDTIKPTRFEDLGAINAVGRPGPLAAGLPQQYGDVKNGKADVVYPIRGCDDFLDPTFGCIIYQEQLMFVSKKVAGFNDMQADSLTRKTIAKKVKAMMPMLIRCHTYGKKNCEGPEGWENDEHAPWYDPKGKYGPEIPGGIANGYTEEEILSYFKTIEKFSEYCFNKSHSQCYAYIGFLTAWLKYYYPEQFMAATLSIQDSAEDVSFYVDVCHKMGIEMAVPDINLSKSDFTPVPESHRILYGLSAVKGLGDAVVSDIVANAPYASIQDCVERIPKKSFNKKVSENLIKAGAFNWLSDNRIKLLNELHVLRKDKLKDSDGHVVKGEDGKAIFETENENLWNQSTCMAFEEATLGSHITYKSWWENLGTNEKASFDALIVSVREHKQKNGKLMAFVTLNDLETNAKIDCCVFAKQYAPLNSIFYGREGKYVTVSGKKSDKGSFIIDDASPLVREVATVFTGTDDYEAVIMA